MSRRDEAGEKKSEWGGTRESKQGNSGTLMRTAGGASRAEDESRRFTRWISFTKPRTVLGFDRLSKAVAPNMKDTPRGIALSLSRVQGWSLPTQLLNDIDSGDFYITVRLSLSLCHLQTKTFFGSTWLGMAVTVGQGDTDKIPDVVDIDYSEIIYMISRLTDPSCVGIIEVVVSKVNKKKNVTISQHGCGWTIIPLFAEPFPGDIADGYDAVAEMVTTFE